MLFLSACNLLDSAKKTTTATDNPVPVVSAISPSVAAAGNPGVMLTVSGSSFQPSSVVMWNGVSLFTSYKGSSTLVTGVPAEDLQSAGTAMVTVVTPAPGGGTSTGVKFTIQASSLNPAPSLTSIAPNTLPAGSSATTITATGTNFVASSTILWNGSALTTTYTNSTTLTAQVPASGLATAGIVAVTVSNPTPGGGTSNAVNFTVGTGAEVVTTLANDLAWDPVNQVIYLSLPSTDGANGNTVQLLDPTTVALGATAPAGSEPNLLSVSATSQFLYVSQLGSSTVQVLTLPGLSSSTTIQLGSDAVDGPFYAMDLQAAPNADGTVAVIRGTPHYSPEEEGGVVIYASGTARTNVICGWIQSGCTNPNHLLMDSIQWKSDASEMFAVNNESSGYDFYTALVDASGFGTVTDYPGLDFANGIGYFSDIHYDATTGYVYGDNGGIIDPSSGTNVGTFAASGIMVPDGTLGTAFFLGQTSQDLGSTNYTLESFDINTFVPIESFTITNVIGTPTHLIRWGTNGLAFTTIDTATTPATGAVYLVNGSLVGVSAKRVPQQLEHVQRTWKPHNPLRSLHSAKDE
jgi:hypothetical protein